jgi:hypothetical protein
MTLSRTACMHYIEGSSFAMGYVEAALWASSEDEGGRSFSDKGKSMKDMSTECLNRIVKDCKAFQASEKKWLERAGDEGQNGHDFWLTRNGHGAGFWDRGYEDDVDKALTKASKAYGTIDLYTGDDRKIHCQ